MGLTNVDFNHFDRTQLVRSLSKNAPLSQVTDGVRVDWEDPVVFRYNGFRTRVIGASPVEGYGTEEARKQIEKAISGIELPDGYFFDWYGEKMASSMAMTNLFNYYPLALLLMLVILLMLFRNYKDVAILVCSIPVVFVGVVPGLLLSGSGLGFVAIVGTLGLVGMIIKNGIILMDEIKLQTSSGKDMKTALVDASVSCLRPVTMAAFTTVLGMIPLLFDAMFASLAAALDSYNTASLWSPRATLLMEHSTADDLVPYEISYACYEQLKGVGTYLENENVSQNTYSELDHDYMSGLGIVRMMALENPAKGLLNLNL